MDVKMIIRYVFCFLILLSNYAFADITIIYQDGFEGTSVNSTYWQSQAQPWTPAHLLPVTTTSQFYSGSRSLFCETFAYTDGGERSEIVPTLSQPWATSAPYNMTYGQDYWIGYAVKYPAGFVSPSGSEWINTTQFHVAGSFVECPTPSLNYNTGQLYLTSAGRYHWYTVNITENCERISLHDYPQAVVVDGNWHTVVIHLRWGWMASQNPIFEIWIDGSKQSFSIGGQTVYSDTRPNCGYMTIPPFLKLGIYAHQAVRQGVYYDAFTAARKTSPSTDAQAYATVSPSGASTNTPPSISITIDGGTTTVTDIVGNQHNFQSTATDNGSVSSVYWHMDGCYADQTVEDPGNLTLSTVGSYDVYATATDNQGATTDSNHILVIIGSPSITGLVNEMEFGDVTNVNTDTQGNTNFNINEGSVSGSVTGTEPNPPNNGTYVATLNGTNQAIGWTEAAYNASAPWQTGQVDGTMILFFTTPSSVPTENMFVAGMWDQTGNERVIQFVIPPSMVPFSMFGVSSGTTYETLPFSTTLATSTTYKVAIRADSSTGEVYARLTQGGTVLETVNTTLSGTMNITNRPDFVIGRREDGGRYFSGDVSWFGLYNTLLSGAQIDSVFGIQQGTGDSSVTVNTGGGTPQIILETGANDLVCSYVSGTGTDTLLFQGTVSAASSHVSLTPVQINSASIDENGGSIGGTGTPSIVYSSHTGQTLGNGDTVSIYIEFSGTSAVTLTMPTEGTAGSLSYQSPFYIDATQSYSVTDYYPCDCTTKTELTGDLFYHTGQKRCQCVEFTGGTPHFDGSSEKMAIREQRDSGGPVYLDYDSGTGTNKWVFSQVVGISEVENTNIVMSNTSEFLLDRFSSGTPAEVLSSGDESVSITLPRTNVSNTGNVVILGTPHIYFGSE